MAKHPLPMPAAKPAMARKRILIVEEPIAVSEFIALVEAVLPLACGPASLVA